MKHIRNDFPFFSQSESRVYLDTAASAQKPIVMIKQLQQLYSYEYANIHRGIYESSIKNTQLFESARDIVAQFINASSRDEIIFTKNATEAINLISSVYGNLEIEEGDEIIVSIMEHHSNIVPWQILCNTKNAKLTFLEVELDGSINIATLKNLLSKKTKLVAITHMSNVFGTIVDIKNISIISRKVGAKVLVDAAQSIVHTNIDVIDLQCDFLIFSAHKLYGPNGVGVLYNKNNILNNFDSYQSGGGMINTVYSKYSTYLPSPHKFEAGTQAIPEVIAFGATLQYLSNIGLHEVWQYEKELSIYITKNIASIAGYKIIGRGDNSIISFVHDTVHHADIGEILNQCNIEIRTGHHCAQPLMAFLQYPGVSRISLGIYNNYEDANKLLDAIYKVLSIIK